MTIWTTNGLRQNKANSSDRLGWDGGRLYKQTQFGGVGYRAKQSQSPWRRPQA
jgi:hypothetical protein